MCMVVYVGSDYPLPTWPWDQSRPAFHVVEQSDPADPVRQRFTKPYVYFAGSQDGCGCGFHYGPYGTDDPDAEVDAATAACRRAFGDYLAVALQHQREVEVYACWSGEEAEPPEYHDRATPAELGSGEAYVRERELVIVSDAPAS
ncbi:hypothetical protein ETAA1_31350 [Urbifossiella limnaea]|uniref:Uncharacterized protein n=2 Tax=Urbifossiella limnaea TaxID=2528023 RepID=A0A517XUK3_9BACT|nr:hypothetical protein ETAA1_31350 [Urbifossiella limnaea]